MFCPNCGKPCRDTDSFCGSCGQKLPQLSKPASSESVMQENTHTPSATSEGRGFNADTMVGEGAILTNSRALAAKLRTEPLVIMRLLVAYAESAMTRGMHYRIIDAANYTMLNPQFAGKHISLSAEDSWSHYVSLLADYYRFGRSTSNECTCYLFIVGGEDVVPMPVIRHYMADSPNFSDKDIDTDVPYAYMLGDKTFDLLTSGKIFEYEQYFHVGRLPFAVDASLDDLTGYLRRVAECKAELEIESYYGQTNMPWGEESEVVCTPLRRAGISSNSERFEGAYVDIDNKRYHAVSGGLFYSIPICEQNLEQVFDTQASLYYFNLHGSNHPTTTGFLADFAGEVITPRHIASIERNNFFVSEACYGARFQNYRRSESMLLSAMGGKSLLYLGSSRIAFCNNRYSIDNSDRLVNIFLEEILAGATAGEALFSARQSFFEYDNGHLYDQQFVSIVEFNLFGDPSLAVQNGRKAQKTHSSRRVMSKHSVQRVCESKCVYSSDSSSKSQSIYEQVRMAVDSNLMKMRKVIDEELYARLNVNPRSLNHIFLNRFADGREFYSFDYIESKENRDDLHYAIVDKNGKIITVISTK